MFYKLISYKSMTANGNNIGLRTAVGLITLLLFISGYCFAHGQSSMGIGSGFVAQSSSTRAATLVCVSGAKDLACLDGDSGHEQWLEPIPGGSVDVGPVIVGSNLVYMGGNGFFTAYGLALDNGHMEWNLDNRSPVLAVGTSTAFLATQGGLGILAVDASNGQIKWKKRPVIVGGTLKQIVVSHGHLYTDSPYVWDANTGEVIEKLPFDPEILTAAEGRIFATGPSQPVFALDAASNTILWKSSNPIKATPEVTPDVALVASAKYVVAFFYKYEADITNHGVMRVYAAKSGKMLWQKRIVSEVALTKNIVSADDQHVYLIEDEHVPNATADHIKSTIVAFDAKTGHCVWQFASSGWIEGPIVSIRHTVFASGDAAPAPNYTVLYAIKKANGTLRWKFSFSDN